MSRLSVVVAGVSALCSLALVGSATAAPSRASVAPDITGVMKDPTSPLRAVVGDDGNGAFFMVERVKTTAKINQQIVLEQVQIGGQMFDVATELRDLALTRIGNWSVDFRATFRGAPTTCTAKVTATGQQQTWDVTASCVAPPPVAPPRVTTPPPVPHAAGPAAPSEAELISIDSACDHSFAFDDGREQCKLDATRMLAGPWRDQVITTIRACSAAFDFESDRASCIGAVGFAHRTPADLVSACRRSSNFPDERLDCVTRGAQR